MPRVHFHPVFASSSLRKTSTLKDAALPAPSSSAIHEHRRFPQSLSASNTMTIEGGSRASAPLSIEKHADARCGGSPYPRQHLLHMRFPQHLPIHLTRLLSLSPPMSGQVSISNLTPYTRRTRTPARSSARILVERKTWTQAQSPPASNANTIEGGRQASPPLLIVKCSGVMWWVSYSTTSACCIRRSIHTATPAFSD